MKRLIFIILFFNHSIFALRSEVNRYTLLNDRASIDHELRDQYHPNFLSIDLNISSGLKKILGDLSDSTEGETNEAQKQINTFSLLSKYVNSEKYIDIFGKAEIPLPDIKIKKHKFYSSLFYNINIGTSFTISNQASATNPEAQTYLRQQTKIGLKTIYKTKKNQQWELALYKLERSDLKANVDSSSLATNEEFFSFDDLKKKQIMYDLDIGWRREKKKTVWLLQVKELKLLSNSDHESLYGSSPLYHIQYLWKKPSILIHFIPFIGVHHRKKYDLFEGIYFGSHFHFIQDSAFFLTTKLSNQFLLFMPQLKTKFFKFSYSYKTPYRNPQDDIWVNAIHNISLTLPMP